MLVSLEVPVVPTSTEHALQLIREARELQLAGFPTTNRFSPLLCPSRLPRAEELYLGLYLGVFVMAHILPGPGFAFA